ncbi:methylmalonyl-CoA epimerase [Angomonas deanei]|nr:methylmalonyl-CoA epimerase [Angomonas deanei]|eukprot:EPY38267.1 methylmalonyl-CoA epimerase [Angomonas deanei]
MDAAISLVSRQMWCMPPDLFFSRNPAMGLLSPSGWSSSILELGSSTNTVITPCSSCFTGSLTLAPRMFLYILAASTMSRSAGTAMATWFNLPKIGWNGHTSETPPKHV